MATPKIFIFHFLVFHIAITSCVQICENSQCPGSNIPIHFPFHLKESQDQCRAYNTTFDLSCSSPNHTIISLPAGKFSVKSIDYVNEEISINGPENCLARQYLKKNFTVSPSFNLRDSFSQGRYIFLNCTPSVTNITTLPYDLLPVGCLSSDNYTVVTVWADVYPNHKLDDLCNVLSDSCVPTGIDGIPLGLDGSDIVLRWDIIACYTCQSKGGTCGFMNESSWEIGCSYPSPPSNSPHGQGLSPRGIAAVAVLVILFITGVICFFTCCKTASQRNQQSNTELTAPIGSRPVGNSIGLDMATVENYSKTVLSEISKQILDPSNNVCSICLSNYQIGETIRTIPNCDHYFHVNCIDEWLMKNATCPLCRDLPRACAFSSVVPSSSLL